MSEPNNNSVGHHIRLAVIALALVLVVLLVFFYAQYESLRQQQIINAREMHWSQLLERHAPLPVTDTGVIRSWMTFDYLNKLFALPLGYLQTQLQISDAHYPRLTISGYAKTENIDTTSFLNEVEAAVREYVAPHNATSTR